MRVMFKPSAIVDDFAFSPNGRSLVSPSKKLVCIWTLRDGSEKVLPVTRRTSLFASVAFSPDGRYIAGGDCDGSLWIWDSRSYTLVAEWRGHTQCARCIEFSKNGILLIGGCDDGTITCWDVTLLGTSPDLQSFPQIREFSRQTVGFFVVFF